MKDIYVLDLETTVVLADVEGKSRKELLTQQDATFICSTCYTKMSSTVEYIHQYYGREKAESAILELPEGLYYTWNGAKFDHHFIYHFLRLAGYKPKTDFKKGNSRNKQLKIGEMSYMLAGSRLLSLTFKSEKGLIEFKDACAIFACSLSKFIQNTCPEFPKLDGEYDYTKFRLYESDFTEKDKDYCRGDVRGFAIGLHRLSMEFEEVFNLNILDSLTAGSFAMKYAQQFINNPNLDPKIKTQEQIVEYKKNNPKAGYIALPKVTFPRGFVGGGRTYVNPTHKGNIVNNIHKIDANSFYPSIMVKEKLPYGDVTIKLMNSVTLNNFLDKNPDLYVFAHLKKGICRYKDQFSPISILLDDGTRHYPCEVAASDEVYLDDSILRDSKLEHDGLWVTYIFKSSTGIFGYLSDIFELKNRYKREGKMGLSLAVKIILNSTYGKFIQRDEFKEYDFFEGLIEASGESTKVNSWFLYPPLGAAITGRARYILTNIMNELGDRFIYSDTDSVVYFGAHPTSIKLGLELGEWDEEASPTGLSINGKTIPKTGEGVFYGRKAYAIEIDGDLSLTFCGISDKAFQEKIPTGSTLRELDVIMRKGVTFNILEGNKTLNGIVLMHRGKYKKYGNEGLLLEHKGDKTSEIKVMVGHDG